jgi:glucose/mannose-6-phosphate isomerase
MFDLIYRLPEHLEDALRIAAGITIRPVPDIKNIVVAGMGGSGIGGDILQALLYRHIPVTVVKDYVGPDYIDKKNLVFVVSYSGETEETLSFYEAARARDCKSQIICISSNGSLAKRAAEHGYPLVKLPAGYPPRAAIAYLFLPMLVILEKLGITDSYSADIEETITLLKAKRDEYNRAAEVQARELVGKIPFIYSTSRFLDPVAYRWRCQFNENAKVFAHSHSFPELDHNEIVGMGSPRNLVDLAYLIILQDPIDTAARTRKRAALTLQIIKGNFYKSWEFTPDGTSGLARIFSGILFGDLLSYHLASVRGVDPLPVDRIENLKRQLRT